MQPFSVLMSVYDKEKPDYLRASLDSIFNQTLMPDEVVLVEDGPLTPELNAVIREFCDKHPELHTLPFKKNRGLGMALHDGLEACKHSLVARMDSDDISVRDRFEKQVQQFELIPQLDVCSTWVDEFEGDHGTTVSVRKLPETHDELYDFGKKRNPVNHPACMFRKESVLKVGSYKDFPLFEDYYLWVRLMINGYRFFCLQESLLKFRRSPEMFKRRGGWSYAVTELRFLRMMHRVGYISLRQLLQNGLIRFVTRIMPNSLRTVIYKKMRK